ncbi:MAG: hypothetical protein AAGB51_13275 [Planctomycetota bacterium]
MAARFDGQEIFGDGPVAFREEGPEQLVVSGLALFDELFGYAYALGLRDFRVVVTGRLVGSSYSLLDSRRDAFRSRVTEPLTMGQLSDGLGGSWDEMSLISYLENGSVERGREWSVGYSATFHRFQVAQ